MEIADDVFDLEHGHLIINPRLVVEILDLAKPERLKEPVHILLLQLPIPPSEQYPRSLN